MPLLQLNTVKHDANDRKSHATLVDIVAVHGLNENLLDAWTDPESQTLWLRDLIPQTIPTARVLTYGYNANSISLCSTGNSPTDRIQHHAETLLADLQANRALENCSQRPIIFVCHGIGGIVVKKALCLAAMKTAPEVRHLYSVFVSTFGILLFGTPHVGSTAAKWMVPPVAKGSKRFFRYNETSQVVGPLDNDSEALQLITDQFIPLMKQFRIFFFWEQVRTNFGEYSGFVVDPLSAGPAIDNTEGSGIDANHSRMIKFTKDHLSYPTVVDALIRFCRSASPVVSRRWRHVGSLLRSHPDPTLYLIGKVFDIRSSGQLSQYRGETLGVYQNKHFYIPEPVSSIYTGREDVLGTIGDALFLDNQVDPVQNQWRYLIYGMGGSGKTQFACKFAQDNRERFWGVFWIDATSIESSNDSFVRIAKIAGVEQTASSGRQWLSNVEETWLLIIDNANNPDLELCSLFPEGERGHILVTTTNPDFRVHATAGSTEFTGLNKQDAVRLLLRAADVPRPRDSVTEERGAKIADALGYLPLALVQAGNFILERICDLENFLTFYDSYPLQTSIRCKPKHCEQNVVHSTLDRSLRLLENRHRESSRDAIQLINILSCFHFEHVRVDIFIKASNNRLKAPLEDKRPDLSAKLRNMISIRLIPPPVLPEFVRQEDAKLDSYRVRRALHELRSFSLINYNESGDTFSLHPLVHSWARDRHTRGEQALWAQVALNTLLESIELPSEGNEESTEKYYRDILPHLGSCLALCPIKDLDYNSIFGKSRSPLAPAWQYVARLDFRNEVIKAAKCGYIIAECGRLHDAVKHLLIVKTALVQNRSYKDEWTRQGLVTLAGIYQKLGCLMEANALKDSVKETQATSMGFHAEFSGDLLNTDQIARTHFPH